MTIEDLLKSEITDYMLKIKFGKQTAFKSYFTLSIKKNWFLIRYKGNIIKVEKLNEGMK